MLVLKGWDIRLTRNKFEGNKGKNIIVTGSDRILNCAILKDKFCVIVTRFI